LTSTSDASAHRQKTFQLIDLSAAHKPPRMRCVTLDAFHVHHVDLRRTRKLNKFVLIRIVLTAQLYLQ
jgi:hypothetical protein